MFHFEEKYVSNVKIIFSSQYISPRSTPNRDDFAETRRVVSLLWTANQIWNRRRWGRAAHYRNRKGLVRGNQRGTRARATEAAFCRDNRRNSQLAAGTAPREWPSLSLELLPRINNRGERGGQCANRQHWSERSLTQRFSNFLWQGDRKAVFINDKTSQKLLMLSLTVINRVSICQE